MQLKTKNIKRYIFDPQNPKKYIYYKELEELINDVITYYIFSNEFFMKLIFSLDKFKKDFADYIKLYSEPTNIPDDILKKHITPNYYDEIRLKYNIMKKSLCRVQRADTISVPVEQEDDSDKTYISVLALSDDGPPSCKPLLLQKYKEVPHKHCFIIQRNIWDYIINVTNNKECVCSSEYVATSDDFSGNLIIFSNCIECAKFSTFEPSFFITLKENAEMFFKVRHKYMIPLFLENMDDYIALLKLIHNIKHSKQ